MGKDNRHIIVDGPLAYVPLTLGMVAVIDAEDVDLVAPYVWHAFKHGRTFYARTNVKRNTGKGYTSLRMHRLILRAPKGMTVDHQDGDGLNNRLRGEAGNLRVATQQQNAMNRRLARNNTSGQSGVYWKKEAGRWTAQLGSKGTKRTIGYFDTKQEAIEARQKQAAEVFGEFAPSHQMTSLPGMFQGAKG